jgi:beta-glucosidase-like glycosyl hydrolase
VNCPAHQELALEAARKAIVLLKNSNNALPLPKVPNTPYPEVVRYGNRQAGS